MLFLLAACGRRIGIVGELEVGGSAQYRDDRRLAQDVIIQVYGLWQGQRGRWGRNVDPFMHVAGQHRPARRHDLLLQSSRVQLSIGDRDLED